MPSDCPSARSRLYSIGHSNHELDRLITLLENAAVTAVADVRSRPFSQRYPQFNRPELEFALRQSGIAYGFLGDALGGRPQSSSVYDDDGRVDYERVRATPQFQKGLRQLLEALDQFTVAMLCAEEDPLDCHRGLMIAPALLEHGIATAHVRGDGSVESMADFERRLLAETGSDTGLWDGLFAPTMAMEERKEMLGGAYRRRASRKAYRRQWEEAAD